MVSIRLLLLKLTLCFFCMKLKFAGWFVEVLNKSFVSFFMFQSICYLLGLLI